MVAPVLALRMIAFREICNTACLYDIRLGVTKLLPVDFNKIFLFFCYNWYRPTLSFRASIVSPVYPDIYCDLVNYVRVP